MRISWKEFEVGQGIIYRAVSPWVSTMSRHSCSYADHSNDVDRFYPPVSLHRSLAAAMRKRPLQRPQPLQLLQLLQPQQPQHSSRSRSTKLHTFSIPAAIPRSWSRSPRRRGSDFNDSWSLERDPSPPPDHGYLDQEEEMFHFSSEGSTNEDISIHEAGGDDDDDDISEASTAYDDALGSRKTSTVRRHN